MFRVLCYDNCAAIKCSLVDLCVASALVYANIASPIHYVAAECSVQVSRSVIYQ